MTPDRTLRLALAPSEVSEDLHANLEGARRRIAEAAARGAHLVCLPEYCLNTDLERRPDLGEAITRLRDACQQHGLWAIFGAEANVDGRRYNSSYLVDPGGEIRYRYDKIHLWQTEAKHFTPGTSAAVIDIGRCQLGIICCWDIAFPRLVEQLARDGAELVVCPSALFDYTVDAGALRALPLARAFENLIYFAQCDIVSPSTLSESVICHPQRELVRGVRSTQLLVADLDLDALAALRTYYRGPG